MSMISIFNLTFAYDGSYDNIFEDVSFNIDTDWKLGFCGRNGRGKTTFLNLLMGKYDFSGNISASIDFEYFPFQVADKDMYTLDVIQAIAPEPLLWQIQREISKLDVDDNALYRPFYTLSNGEQTKALLAGLFLRENSFLLIDEPTNHLDMKARQTVAKYLKSKSGFILVSHDRVFLDECTDHTLSINKNNIEIVHGNFSVWWEQKRRQDAFELAQNKKLSKEIGRLEAAAKRTSKWSDDAEKRKVGINPNEVDVKFGWAPKQAAKSKKMMERSKAIQARQQSNIEEKSKLLKNIESSEILKIRPLSYHTSRLLSLEDVTVSYDGNEVVKDMSFTVENGERIALLGGNGSGKSSIIKLINGEIIPHTGNANISNRLIISYVPQDASFLEGDLNEYAKTEQIDVTLFKTILRKLDFSRVQFDKDMGEYSAGQKKKVLLARSLCQQAHIYIWDEPLNYIDVFSRMQIEDLIITYKPTLIFVEHDRLFCESIATKIIKMKK